MLKGTRKTIGGIKNTLNTLDYESHELDLLTGDILYLTTDGFTDQNDNSRKRFGSQKFIELLHNNAFLPLIKQKNVIEKSLDEWQSDEKQRDDITVLGIKL